MDNQVSIAAITAERMAARAAPADLPLYVDEASAFLRLLGRPLSRNTLEKMRSIGNGPPCQKNGRAAVYLAGDLRAWVQSEMKPHRTSI